MSDFGCCACGTKPFSAEGGRQCWDLMFLDSANRHVAGDDESGRWYCSQHFERIERRRYRILADIPPDAESKSKGPKPSAAAVAFADLTEAYTRLDDGRRPRSA
jgi:hypothetical protein